MNNNLYRLITILFLSSFLYSLYAVQNHFIVPNPQLIKTRKGYFKDTMGITINYPCSHGGEPLVIYSTLVANPNPISSKSTIYPLYVKNGYEATILTIPDFQKNKFKSTKNLIVQTINPAFGNISYSLERTDKQKFYVNTANFPVVKTLANKDGTRDKYVSNYNININHSSKLFTENKQPVYNYSFSEDTGLNVFHYVNQITANVASWNQNGKWTNAALGRNVSNIRYIFTPQRSDDPNFYNGFGFWICGSDHKGSKKKFKNNKNIYQDKISHGQ